MLRVLFILFILNIVNVIALNLKPNKVFTASGSVLDIQYKNKKIYVATDASNIDIIDFKTKKIIKQIKLPQIKDFMGELVNTKIYSIDIYKNNILLVSQSKQGRREIYIYNKILKNIISYNDNIIVTKAKFINKDLIVFSTLGNELYLFDIKDNKIIKRIDIKNIDDQFNSKFSDMCMDTKRSKLAISDESGDIKIVNLEKFQIVNVLKGNNLDNVFKIDWKKDYIITARQDRKSFIYDLKNDLNYYFKTNFLIYAAALSPQVKLGAYSSDEQNNVTIFDVKTRRKLYNLIDNKMTLTSILFINENELFITSDSPMFNYYNLKGK
jgi:hypothetical protein